MPQTQHPNSRFQVWGFYHHLFHYRLPVWDLLAERGRGRYDLTFFGETDSGKAIGGGARPYLREMPVGGFSRRVGYTFQGARELVEREKPDVLLVLANPRNRFCWQAPGLARSYGGVSIAWSKIHSYSGVPRWLLDPLKRRFYGNYDFAFTYGPASTAELLQLGYPRERAFDAFNTVDTRFIFDDMAGIHRSGDALRRQAGLDGKKVLLCVSKMAPQKRHQDLLEAWPKIRELDPNLVLVLIGRGPLTDQVRSRAKEIDSQRIFFLGGVPEGDDYRWIATADVTIQCGMVGLVLNQSMALGTPTIIADEPGADSEILEHGQTGWRYERANVSSLVDTVRRVLTDDEARRAITANAQRFMKEQVTIDRMVDGLDACISAAIGLRRTRNGA